MKYPQKTVSAVGPSTCFQLSASICNYAPIHDVAVPALLLSLQVDYVPNYDFIVGGSRIRMEEMAAENLLEGLRR